MLTRMPRSARLLFCLGALLFPFSAIAQNAVSTGAISGQVLDPKGAAVPGVAVTATGSATGVKLTSTTNGDGIYGFPALQVGTYTLTFSGSGFKSTQIADVAVGVGHTTDGGTTLQIGSTTEQVQVEASTLDLNPSDTTVGTLVEKQTIDGLPLSGRRYTDFVLLTPNVTADGQFGHISFAGQSGGDLSGYNNTAGGASNANGSTAFTVDGADSTSYYYGDNRGFTRIPYIFGLQSIQEFQVQRTSITQRTVAQARVLSILSPSRVPMRCMVTCSTTIAIQALAPMTRSTSARATKNFRTRCSNSAPTWVARS